LKHNLIKFNTPITEVEINNSEQTPITLTSGVGTRYKVDSLIVTIPLGLLKTGAIQFSPPLPSPVQKAISTLGFGVLEKLFVRFPRAWWLTPLPDVSKAPVALEFYRFSSLISTKDQIPRGSVSWVSLARMHKPQPVFLIYVSTELAKYLVAMPKDKLRSMLQTYYVPRLPNYSADDPACQISAVDSSQWSLDPLSGYGSYTHIPVGAEIGDGNMKILSEKIFEAGDGGVWFAGEHTADTEIHDGVKYTTMATVTGAYKSGERAANHVLKSLG
jgi:monoamine oxidase